jgi:hypothetical protein
MGPLYSKRRTGTPGFHTGPAIQVNRVRTKDDRGGIVLCSILIIISIILETKILFLEPNHAYFARRTNAMNLRITAPFRGRQRGKS